jgi:hypothetical protein
MQDELSADALEVEHAAVRPGVDIAYVRAGAGGYPLLLVNPTAWRAGTRGLVKGHRPPKSSSNTRIIRGGGSFAGRLQRAARSC